MRTRTAVRSSRLLACAVASLAAAPIAWAQQPDPDRFIVKFANSSEGRRALAAAGASVLLELPEVGAAAVRIPAQALEGLQRSPGIEYIERDQPRYPLSQTTPYGIAMVQANLVSDAGAMSRTVCIIDSGYSMGHEDLDGYESVGGANLSLAWDSDGCGHGTHVAGTIAALNNSVGVVGVLPSGNVKLHIVRVFGDSCAWAYASDLIDAAYRCADAEADVINMSLGCSGRVCRSTAEEQAFDDLEANRGVLSVAAAGNDGNTQDSYPASYDSVVSVAAVDSAGLVADFSQQNAQVELSGPGVAVRSTVPEGTGTGESLAVGSDTYEVAGMDGAPDATGTGSLVDCGLATAACPGGGGQVCLILRGEVTFAEKVANCEAGGGVGAVIYNNADPLFAGTLGGAVTTIPSVSTAGTNGAALLGHLGDVATVTTGPGNYAFFDGTSMATPHVAGVAALVWSHDPSWTNRQVREALGATALDLGSPGRDVAYGFGLVQAEAALDYLEGAPPPPPGISLSAAGYKVKGRHTVDLSWSGATGTLIDVYRDAALVATTANDGLHTDAPGGHGRGSYAYQVCEVGTSTCSDTVNVGF